MPTKEQQAVYNETRKAKRKQDRFEAMPEAQALRAELSALQRGIAGEQVYMGSADYESTLRERVELWKSAYEHEVYEKECAQDMRESNLRFLKSQMQDTVDRVSEAFRDGVKRGRKQEAVRTRQVEEELAAVMGNFKELCSLLEEVAGGPKENDIFLDPNDSPSRSPKRKKKKKSKWGGDRVSAKWRAAHYGSSPVRPTGNKQVV